MTATTHLAKVCRWLDMPLDDDADDRHVVACHLLLEILRHERQAGLYAAVPHAALYRLTAIVCDDTDRLERRYVNPWARDWSASA